MKLSLRLLLACAFINGLALPLFARPIPPDPTPPSGNYGSAVELNVNGNLTLYVLDSVEDTGTSNADLLPTGSGATLDQSSWSNGTESSPVLNLGTFIPALGQTLTLTGGSLLTYDGGGSVTNGYLDFRIFQGTPSGAFTEFSLPLNLNNVKGISGRKRWSVESKAFNLLSNLPVGTYTLGVYLRDAATDGGSFSRYNGQNFGATFSVLDLADVPEPSSLLLIGGAGLALALLRLRRARV